MPAGRGRSTSPCGTSPARSSERPVWRMLGGRSPRLRLYASTAVHRPVREMVDTARRMLDAGFEAMKVRFGRPSIDDDLAVLTADPQRGRRRSDADGRLQPGLANAVGHRTAVGSATRAWMVAEQLMAEGVFWMEEPLHRGDYAGMTELRRRVRQVSSMRIAGGEMTREPYEFRELLQRDCLDVFQPDAACTQGISGLSQLARDVVAAGKVFTPHTWGNGIGVLANLHLPAGTVGHEGSLWVEWPYDPPEWSIERRDYPIVRHLRAEGGWFTLGDEPGLGRSNSTSRCWPARSARRPRSNERLTSADAKTLFR